MASAAAPVAAGRRIKTAKEYFEEPMTANQQAFLAFVIRETGVKLKNKGEEEIFAKGVKAAGLYARYQASKRQPVQVEPPKPGPRRAPTKRPAQKAQGHDQAQTPRPPEQPQESDGARSSDREAAAS